MNPCTCGAPFRDYDNRCLRCKKPIGTSRAEKLPFHRMISEIGPCKCPEETQQASGVRATSVAELILCNSCDLRVGGPEIEEPDVTKAKEEAKKKEVEAKALQERRTHEFERIINAAKSGESIYLYKSVYMSINSENVLGNERTQIAPFHDKNIRHAGANGWRVVASTPRTLGEALQNYEGFGKAWAGAIGGSIIGAYVLMEFLVTASNVDSSQVWIKESVESYID